MHIIFDTSHWNYPIDLERLYEIGLLWGGGAVPGLINKISEGRTQYNDGLLTAVNAKSVGWTYIGGYHFYDRRTTPTVNAETYLRQWDKVPFTILPSLDNEITSYMPNPLPLSYPGIVKQWFAPVELAAGKPGLIYSNVSFVGAYLNDPELTSHGLWLSQTSANLKVSLAGPTVPLPWVIETLWQKSFVNKLGRFVGASSNHIDINVCRDIKQISL